MSLAPKSVIHINFMPGSVFFDARPIWAALNNAVASGKLRSSDSLAIQDVLGYTAIHIATRFLVMRFAYSELQLASKTLYSLASKAHPVESIPNTFVLNDVAVETTRDHLLLAVDSFLFEFRAFLELMAKFTYRFLLGIGKKPINRVQLSTGDTVALVNRKGDVYTHNFLRYLCDALNVRRPALRFSAAREKCWVEHLSRWCRGIPSGAKARRFYWLYRHDKSRALLQSLSRMSLFRSP